MVIVTRAVVIASFLSSTSNAFSFWSFREKRFKDEGFISAGSLGLDELTRSVVAFADWNGDQSTDLFTLSTDRKTLQVYLWDHQHYQFNAAHSLTTTNPIQSVIPGDFNYDGRLDALILTRAEEEDGGWWSNKNAKLEGLLYLGGGESGGFVQEPTTMDSFTSYQPSIIDFDGRLQLDLLGSATVGRNGKEQLKLWRNEDGQFTTFASPLQPASDVCQLANPHSNAFIDMDGDCLADIFLTCEGGAGLRKTKSFQIWRNDPALGFKLAGEWQLPDGAGAISFADMDRDGTIDLVFPTCRSHNTGSGIGSGCRINIAYNKQKPLCVDPALNWLKAAGQAVVGKKQDCRKHTELCQADVNFDFVLDPTGDSFTSIPLEDLFNGTSTIQLSQPTSDNHDTPIYMPLKVGDYNQNGFPDILLLLVNSTAKPAPGGLFGGSRGQGVQVKLLESKSCGKDVKGCENKVTTKRRTFEVVTGKGMGALDEIWDARSVSWLDIDENGSLDIMVQRTGVQTESRVTFIQNNFFHDAFFLKTLVLNGACEGACQKDSLGQKYKPYGAASPGATFKFTVLDSSGHRVATQVSQLAQVAYEALGTPYNFFGLGRTNNYVDNLFVGSTLRRGEATTILEGIIPNSQVVITPPALSTNESVTLMVSQAWHKELYLHPGEWIHLVVLVLIGLIVVLGGVVYGLHQNEKREDEIERRRALHSINFQAL